MKPWEIVSETLTLLVENAKDGVSTLELDKMAHENIFNRGGEPYNLGYKPDWAPYPFPAITCISINDELVHGIPSDEKVLKNGMLVKFDLGVKKDGICGDGAITVGIGEIENKDERLLRYAKKILYAGIDAVGPGVKLGAISEAIYKESLQAGYKINRTFANHFIGKEMHEEPSFPNVYVPNLLLNDIELKVGWMLCLEPIVMYSKWDDRGKADENGWTWKSVDGKNSAVFEHQLLVTDNGCEVLTTHFGR